MKRIVLVVLVGILSACDAISNPRDSGEVTATVEGGGRTIGAVLLSTQGTVDSVTVTAGKSVVLARNGLTYVAAVRTVPGSSVTFELWGGAPDGALTVLQVSDGNDTPYDDPGSFTVTTQGD